MGKEVAVRVAAAGDSDEGHEGKPELAVDPDAFVEQTERERVLEAGITKFNLNPKRGVSFLVDHGLLERTPKAVAAFLRTPRLFAGHTSLRTGLHAGRVGDYIAQKGRSEEEDAFFNDLRREYLASFDFSGLGLVDALRAFLTAGFRLPGESQMIDRMMECFAAAYCDANPDVYSHPDVVYVLSFALIMLNTDLHNPNVARKMSLDSFINIHRGIDAGQDLPRDLLEGLYEDIRDHAIEMEMETDVVTFFNPRMEGWLRKRAGSGPASWARRYFLLTGSVLYYFLNQREIDQASPRCIIPLENAAVEAVGADRLRIVAAETAPGGLIKSAKRMKDGSLRTGKRSKLELKAASGGERDEWLHAVSHEVRRQESPLQRIVNYKKFALRSTPRDVAAVSTSTPHSHDSPHRASVSVVPQHVVGDSGTDSGPTDADSDASTSALGGAGGRADAAMRQRRVRELRSAPSRRRATVGGPLTSSPGSRARGEAGSVNPLASPGTSGAVAAPATIGTRRRRGSSSKGLLGMRDGDSSDTSGSETGPTFLVSLDAIAGGDGDGAHGVVVAGDRSSPVPAAESHVTRPSDDGAVDLAEVALEVSSPPLVVRRSISEGAGTSSSPDDSRSARAPLDRSRSARSSSSSRRQHEAGQLAAALESYVTSRGTTDATFGGVARADGDKLQAPFRAGAAIGKKLQANSDGASRRDSDGPTNLGAYSAGDLTG